MANEEIVQGEINDVLEDYMPTQDVSTPTPTKGAADGTQGQERQTQETSGQEPVSSTAQEAKGEVGEPVVETPPQPPVVKTPAPVLGEQAPPAVPPVTPETPPQLTEVEMIKKENEELRKHLEEMASKVVDGPQKRQPTEQEVAQQQQQADAAKRQVLNFLPTEEAFDEVLKNKDSFNAFMTAVVNVAVERSLRVVPSVVVPMINNEYTLRTSVNDFYKDNKDLKPHQKYVGFVANEVTAQNPDWGVVEVLQETEKLVRERLKMKKPVDGTNDAGIVINAAAQSGSGGIRTAESSPGLAHAGGSGGRRASAGGDSSMSSVEKSVLDLIS